MEMIGQSSGYNLYRNSAGEIEGYLKKGKQVVNGQDIGTGLAHIITNCKTIEEFEQLIAANKKSSIKPKEPPQPELF